MFLDFFYLLRAKGLKVSLVEWMSLAEALDKGLCGCSLMGFYSLCRSLLVKDESDYDKLDMAFAEYFENVVSAEDLPDEFRKWLEKAAFERHPSKADLALEKQSFEEIMRKFKERRKEQTERHDGGNYWIGTGGTSTMGHSGYHKSGVRTFGKGMHKSAVKIAGDRAYKDFRHDTQLDLRQFQMAFRKLRQFSSRVDTAMTEFDIDKTIEETSRNCGNLKIEYTKPRKNTVKLLILFDSGGTMSPFSDLSNELFQAVYSANHFKSLKTYYFHNCVYDRLYTTPECMYRDSVETDWVLNNLDSDYKVIFVGDAIMSQYELFYRGGSLYFDGSDEYSGWEWLNKLKDHFRKQIWLTPISSKEWEGYHYLHGQIKFIRQLFSMYELTVEGLEEGIKALMSR